ncbi:hypothetical protein D3C80_2055530 [compost metagenome]
MVRPSPRIPAPSAPQTLSAPPANTFVEVSSPEAPAISGSSVPVCSNDSTSLGHRDTGREKASAISVLHCFAPTSSSRVPAASE